MGLVTSFPLYLGPMTLFSLDLVPRTSFLLYLEALFLQSMTFCPGYYCYVYGVPCDPFSLVFLLLFCGGLLFVYWWLLVHLTLFLGVPLSLLPACSLPPGPSVTDWLTHKEYRLTYQVVFEVFWVEWWSCGVVCLWGEGKSRCFL